MLMPGEFAERSTEKFEAKLAREQLLDKERREKDSEAEEKKPNSKRD